MNSMTLRASQTPIVYEDDGTGPTLVLLHAFPLDSGMWRDQRRALADGYHVIAPDFPGFGGSAVSAGLTIDSAADVVAELLDHLGVNERVAVCGLSMGGYVALAFARLYPQRLRALILADTKADPDDATGREARNNLIEAVTLQGPQAAIERLLPKLLAAGTNESRPYVVRRVREMAERQSMEGFIAALKALRDRPDANAGLPHISVPTLVIVGEEDQVTPIDKAEALSRLVPDARLAVFSSCGHLSNLEDPDAFNRAVRQFLDSLPPEVRGSRTV
jgi:pimeloyl-ACP methyl ester carboxylesterase